MSKKTLTDVRIEWTKFLATMHLGYDGDIRGQLGIDEVFGPKASLMLHLNEGMLVIDSTIIIHSEIRPKIHMDHDVFGVLHETTLSIRINH
jgi:hypothetical protein